LKPEKAFGLVLKKLRNKINLSQEKLAFECNLDRTFISLLERGLRQPSLTTIIEISSALNIQPDELMAMTMKLLSGGENDNENS